MLKATCHCGAISLEIDAPPTEITECNCSICHRYGVLWAYYPLSQVRLVEGSGPTDIYMWDDKTIEFHRCRTCGCVTHWSAVDPLRDRTGINARLIPVEVLAKARLRHLDGANTEEYLD